MKRWKIVNIYESNSINIWLKKIKEFKFLNKI